MARSTLPLILCGLMLYGMTALAAKSDWTRYENDHFLAYSDAKEKDVIKLLLEIEEFRSAFLQVSLITVPADAPKTKVVIMRSRRDFSKMASSPKTAGFFRSINGQTIIVMPASGNSMDKASVIRHEYAHTLMSYKGFAYPTWFQEGFAELAAAIQIDSDSQTFMLGEATKRAEVDGNLVADWTELLDDDFKMHSISKSRLTSVAYTQSWLLTHYAVLGDKGGNTPKLKQYFDLLASGEPSLLAFESAFNMTPEEIWDEALKEYVANLPVYKVKFRAEGMDTGFQKTPAGMDEVNNIMGFFQKSETDTK